MNHLTPTTRKLFLLASLFGLLVCASAQAQVAVRLQMNKSNYLLGEPVTATVSITNHAGRQLVLSGDGVNSWLNFQLSLGGNTLSPARKINYKPTVIPIGQTVARTVNLTTSYALGNMGNYRCSASIKMPGSKINGFVSNRVRFTVTSGRNIWAQRAGLPSNPNQIREYKLVTFTGNQGLDLYAQVSSQNTGRRIATVPLGKIMNFRNPTAKLDSANTMHCLYQIKPDLYAHAAISPNGQVLSSGYHKSGASGAPRLITFGNGVVKVAGSIPYDPKVEAEKRSKIRKISERPPFIYR